MTAVGIEPARKISFFSGRFNEVDLGNWGVGQSRRCPIRKGREQKEHATPIPSIHNITSAESIRSVSNSQIPRTQMVMGVAIGAELELSQSHARGVRGMKS